MNLGNTRKDKPWISFLPALVQHTKRAVYQGEHCWGKLTFSCMWTSRLMTPKLEADNTGDPKDSACKCRKAVPLCHSHPLRGWSGQHCLRLALHLGGGGGGGGATMLWLILHASAEKLYCFVISVNCPPPLRGWSPYWSLCPCPPASLIIIRMSSSLWSSEVITLCTWVVFRATMHVFAHTPDRDHPNFRLQFAKFV